MTVSTVDAGVAMGLGHRRRQRDRLGEDIPASQLESGPDQAVRQETKKGMSGMFTFGSIVSSFLALPSPTYSKKVLI